VPSTLPVFVTAGHQPSCHSVTLRLMNKHIASRAGRDGQPSESVLYCSQAELKQLKKLERPLRAGAAAAVAE
jgi:hypothetical protein